jgi:D-serine deaminase-like pyridoxal phosphate-dependent protein
MLFQELSTPAALLDVAKMQRNIDHMQTRMNALGVKFRPHVKTSKYWPVVQAQMTAGAVVSTPPLHFGLELEVEAVALTVRG